jgi:flagellar hook assembly protein FlgD
VQIYNTRGQLVKTLFTGNKDKGKFLLQWNGTDQLGRKQPSGIYLIRMDSNGKQSLRKVVLSE